MRASSAFDHLKNTSARKTSATIPLSGYSANDGTAGLAQPGSSAPRWPSSQFQLETIKPVTVSPNTQARTDHIFLSAASVNRKIAFGQSNTSRSANRLTNAVSASVKKKARRRHHTMSQAFSSAAGSAA